MPLKTAPGKRACTDGTCKRLETKGMDLRDLMYLELEEEIASRGLPLGLRD